MTGKSNELALSSMYQANVLPKSIQACVRHKNLKIELYINEKSVVM